MIYLKNYSKAPCRKTWGFFMMGIRLLLRSRFVYEVPMDGALTKEVDIF